MTRGWVLGASIAAIGLATSLHASPPINSGDQSRKHYVGHSVAGCEVIDYGCPPGWSGFQDAQGCGCIAPPAAAKPVKTHCPKSGVIPK